MPAIISQTTADEMLRHFHDEEMAETNAALRAEVALLSKLNIAELRVLLVHYGYADDARDAKTWSKTDLVDGIAEHRVFRAA